MLYRIILLLAAASGLLLLPRTRGILARSIVACQVVAIGISFLSMDRFTAWGWRLHFVALGGIMMYSLVREGLRPAARKTLFFLACLSLLTHLFQLHHYPGAGGLGLALAVPLGACLFQVVTGSQRYKQEMAFLVIAWADAAILFVKRIEWILN